VPIPTNPHFSVPKQRWADKPVNAAPNNAGLGILKATGVVLPVVCGGIYVVGSLVREDLLLPVTVSATVLGGVAGYCVGMRWNGRALTVLGLIGYAVLALGLAILYWHSSKPIPVPPYP
jgi:hypothetical protein